MPSRAHYEQVGPRRIYLFGSYARGSQTSDSDIDLLIVADEFAAWEKSLNHIVARAAREGKLVYERS